MKINWFYIGFSILIIAVLIGGIANILQPEEPKDPMFFGNKEAKIQVAFYYDYDCPYCKQANEVINQILNEYPNEIGIKFIPFVVHPSAVEKTKAVICAANQNKFLEYHNILFNNQNNKENLGEYTQSIGLDTISFNQCLNNSQMGNSIMETNHKSIGKGIQGVPAIRINGELYYGGQDMEFWENLIRAY